MTEQRDVTAPEIGTFRDPTMWSRVRLEDGLYWWILLCGSDCDEPWNFEEEDHDVN